MMKSTTIKNMMMLAIVMTMITQHWMIIMIIRLTIIQLQNPLQPQIKEYQARQRPPPPPRQQQQQQQQQQHRDPTTTLLNKQEGKEVYCTIFFSMFKAPQQSVL